MYDALQKRSIRLKAAGVLAAAFIVILSACGTNWEPIFVGVDAVTAGQIQVVLNDADISSRIDVTEGVVLVPLHQADQAITAVHMSSSLWNPAYTFQDAIGTMSAAPPQTQEMLLRWMRAYEMAQTLMLIGFIDTASIQLNALDATVMVNVTGSRTLTPEDGEVIALMVSRMVNDLPYENVTVIDENFNVLWGNTNQ